MQDRRTFLEQIGFAAAGLFIAEGILADPARPVDVSGLTDVAGTAGTEPAAWSPIRIRGRVHAGGRGIEGVGVSDGLSVVRSGGEGRFEIVSSSRRRFVHVSLPAGYRIPVNDTGTARFYRPIEVGRDGEMSVEFALDPAGVDDRRHAFLLMADPQMLDVDDVGRLHGESVPDLIGTVRGLAPLPVFGVACGDVMYDRLGLLPEYERAVERIGIPCFQVMGNHDVEVEAGTDEQSAGTFERHFGPAYYSFNRGEIHYIVLDDIFWFGRYIGYMDQTQLDWLRADLALLERGRTVVVFMHIPPYIEHHLRHGKQQPNNTTVVTNRELLYEVLEPFNTYFVCGHMHESEFLRDGGAEIHVCGALCGAWWTDSICYDGTPNGYMIYGADGSNLAWRYKSIGKGIDHQMCLYAPGAVPEFPGDVVANVWGADGDWKVAWFEGGMRKGLMKRRLGTDPTAERLFRGPALPPKHVWVDPVRTDHLFTAKPSPALRDVVIEAVDRWGHVYSQRLAW